MTLANRIAFVLLLTALLFTTLAYGGVHQPVIAMYYVIVAAAGIAVSYGWIRAGKVMLTASGLQLPLIGAALYALVQLVPFGTVEAGVGAVPRTISLDPNATWMTFLHFVSLILFFGAMLSVLNSAMRIRTVAVVVTIFGFAYAFFAILQSVLSPQSIYGIYNVPDGSPFGSFVNRNNFATFMEMTIALPLGLVVAGAVERDKQLLVITAVVLMSVALLLSGSRGGLVALIAAALLIVFLTRKGRSRKELMLKFGLVAVFLVVVVAGAIFVGGDTSLTRIAETAAAGDITTDRSHIWAITLKVIAEHFPLGAGFGAYHVAYTQYDTLSGVLRVEQAHNDYLQVLADAGLPGLVLGLLFLYLFVRTARRALAVTNKFRRGIALGTIAGCFAVLVHSIFDFGLHITAVALMFFTLLSLLNAAGNEYGDDFPNDDRRPHRRKGLR